jgi:flagellar biosynthetic protein FliO
MKNFFKFNNKINTSGSFQGFGFFNNLNSLQKSAGQSNKSKFKPAIIFLVFVFVSVILLYFFGLRQGTADPYEVAQSQTTQAHTAQAQTGSIDLIIKFVVGMIIVAALIYITVYVLRYFYTRRGRINVSGNSNSGGTINLLESMNLDSNRKLHLVKIADRVLLLSSSENQVSLLTELKKEEIEKIPTVINVNESLNENKNFKSVFLGLFKNNN